MYTDSISCNAQNKHTRMPLSLFYEFSIDTREFSLIFACAVLVILTSCWILVLIQYSFCHSIIPLTLSPLSNNGFCFPILPMKEKGEDVLPKIKIGKAGINTLPPVNKLESFRKHEKEYEKWSPEEVLALKRGFEKHGAKWTTILSQYDNVFQGRRRVVDLANKMRLLNKNTSFYKTEPKDWLVLTSAGEPEIDQLGEIITVRERFPHDAAKKLARRRILSGIKKFIIRIREAQNIENVHTYSVEVNEFGNATLKKLIGRE